MRNAEIEQLHFQFKQKVNVMQLLKIKSEHAHSCTMQKKMWQRP